MISGNMVGMYSTIGKTLTLVDENGIELTGVVVDQETIFTATDSTVASGFVYAGDSGVSTGTREFLAYRTTQGTVAIPNGSNFSISLSQLNKYDYTKFHCMVAPYNESITNSVAVDRVAIFDSVYSTESAEKISTVTKNETTKSIDLNIVNDSGKPYVIHYFTYKEEEL